MPSYLLDIGSVRQIKRDQGPQWDYRIRQKIEISLFKTCKHCYLTMQVHCLINFKTPSFTKG